MVATIAWQSKKICRVTKSPLALETLSLSEVADAGFMIASMVQEINCLSSLPSVLCKIDNSQFVNGNSSYNKTYQGYALTLPSQNY